MITPPPGYQVIAFGNEIIAVDKAGAQETLRYNEVSDTFETLWPTSVKSYTGFAGGNGAVQVREFEG